jgi:N-acetylated-alpha-linked acidic dipeptidase
MNDLERRLLDAVSLDAPWELVETFSRMPRWMPEDVSRGAYAIVERLRRHGVPVTVHEPEIFLSVPLSASVEAGGVTHRAKPPTSGLPVPEGRTAPLAYLSANPKALRSYSRDVQELFGGSIASESEARRLVGGRIVVTEGFGNPALASLVEEWGGVGLIAANPGVDVHWGTCTTVWGTSDLDDLPRKPRIPVVAVNKASGEALAALARAGGSATIRTELMEGFQRQKIPVAHIPGATEPDKFVLVHGHYDSWDVGVGDNATGDAAMLEIARVLWLNRDKLERSVRIAWWPGHSTGRFAGSTWYADEFALHLARNCLAHLNCDSPGCRDATDYIMIPWMAENADFVRGVVRDAAGKAADGKRPSQSSDFSFNNLGITGFFSSSSRIPKKEIERRGYYYVMGNGGNLEWHTDDDLMPVADRDILLTDIKVYLLAVFRLANSELLPWDWRALLRELDDTLGKYASAAGARFDLSSARDAVAALDAALARFADATEAGRIKPAVANDVLLALSRLLVPLNYTRGTRWRRDLSVPAPPMTALAVATELDRYPPSALGFAQTHLRRGLNQVLAALEEARERVTAVLPR